jgi:hypothetical protein
VVRRPWWPRGNPEPAHPSSRLCLLTRQACGACVALVWHVWHLGKQSATRETLILQGFEARVALEALVFDLDLETKNRKMMFYLTPVKQIEPKQSATPATRASNPYGARFPACGTYSTKVPPKRHTRLTCHSPEKRHSPSPKAGGVLDDSGLSKVKCEVNPPVRLALTFTRHYSVLQFPL